MPRNYGVDKLEARHFKQLLSMYVRKIRRIREHIRETNLPDEDREFLLAKIERLKKKAFAVIKEFLYRVEMKIDPTVHDDGTNLDLRAPCPSCKVEISLVKAVTIDRPTMEIYLKCPNCGAESRRLKIG